MTHAWQSLEGPLLYAHRGCHARWPENSLPAFREALELGADALELDVHVTRDGVPVVSHDPDGQRSAGVARAIADCTWGEVSTWALAGAPPGSDPVRVLRFEELLEALPGALLNVDLKPLAPDPLAPMLEAIARHDAEDRVLLTSFASATLRRVRAAGYAGAVGLGQSEAMRAVLAPRLGLRLWPVRGCRLQIPTRYGPLRLGVRRVIERAHRLGLGVDYWVVDDATDAEALLDAGADGLVTDRLDVLAGVFARSPATGGWRARHPELAVAAAAR